MSSIKDRQLPVLSPKMRALQKALEHGDTGGAIPSAWYSKSGRSAQGLFALSRLPEASCATEEAVWRPHPTLERDVCLY